MLMGTALSMKTDRNSHEMSRPLVLEHSPTTVNVSLSIQSVQVVDAKNVVRKLITIAENCKIVSISRYL